MPGWFITSGWFITLLALGAIMVAIGLFGRTPLTIGPVPRAPLQIEAVSFVVATNQTVTAPQDMQPVTSSPTTPVPVKTVIRVQVIDVDESEERCGVRVGREFAWIDKGDVERIGGVYIYVADVFAVHSAGKDSDACELVIGGYGRAIAREG